MKSLQEFVQESDRNRRAVWRITRGGFSVAAGRRARARTRSRFHAQNSTTRTTSALPGIRSIARYSDKGSPSERSLHYPFAGSSLRGRWTFRSRPPGCPSRAGRYPQRGKLPQSDVLTELNTGPWIEYRGRAVNDQ